MESKRQRQVNEIIKRHFSTVLLEEGRTLFGDALVSVTNVVVSPDLGQAKIYVSVFNAESKEAILGILQENMYLLKQSLARRVRNHIRRMPRIMFYIDDLVDQMYQVDALFDKIGPIPSLEEE